MAAVTLFKEKRFEDVTMIDIAKKAAVSKGTLYVYFLTKEAIFLDHAKDQIHLFFNGLNQHLDSCDNTGEISEVVSAINKAYTQSIDMIRTLSVLHTVLENNAGFDRALKFRTELIPLIENTGLLFEKYLDFLKQGEGKRLILTIHGISLGFHQLSNPTEVIKKVQQAPNMDLYDFDFKTALLNTVDLLLTGMETRAKS